MGFSQVVLARVGNVHNVRDLESFYDMSIACVMPVAQVETSREYLIWVAVCALPKFDQ